VGIYATLNNSPIYQNILGDLNTKINAINEELAQKMSSQAAQQAAPIIINNNIGGANHISNQQPPSNASSAAQQHKPSTGNSTQSTPPQPHHTQIQYCGPYRLEKTLGKGQTGEWWGG